jgi:hypothetical protein
VKALYVEDGYSQQENYFNNIPEGTSGVEKAPEKMHLAPDRRDALSSSEPDKEQIFQ